MIHLRELDIKDAEGMLEWMHDPDIWKNFQIEISSRTYEDVKTFIADSEYVLSDGCSIHFAVADEQDEYLGTVSLKEINMRDRHAEYAVSLRKCAQGKGIGYEATQLLLEYAFCTIGLNRVFLNVLSDNLSAIRLYQKCGFRFEGEFVNHLFLRDRYRSLKWYGIEKKEYLEKRKSYEDHAKQTG